MCEDINNIVWDLDGLVDLSQLEYGTARVMWFLWESAQKTEKFSRSQIFNESLEYTTSPAIYKKLGLLSFRFEKSLFYGRTTVVKYYLCGNLEIINSILPYIGNNVSYSNAYSSPYRENFVEKVIVSPSPKINNLSISELYDMFRIEKYKFENRSEIFNNTYNFKLDYHRKKDIYNLLYLCQNYYIELNRPVEIELTKDMLDLNINFDYNLTELYRDLKLLCKWCPVVLCIDLKKLLSYLENYDKSVLEYFSMILGETGVRLRCNDINKFNISELSWKNKRIYKAYIADFIEK